MILRRLSTALRKQDWFTVLIETLIVMFGVFLGIQVANWNGERASHTEYVQALTRLETEIAGNLGIIEREGVAIADSLSIVRAGLDALVTCAEGSDAIAQINASIAEARGTRGIQFQFPVLKELTSNPVLLSEQTDAERQRFASLLFRLELSRETSARFEPLTLESWPANTSTLTIKPAQIHTGVYFDQPYEVLRYPLVLDVDMSSACRDKELLKWLHRWEAWQSNVILFHQQVGHEYGVTKSLLEARR